MTRIDDVDYVGFSRQDCKAANVVQACLVSIHVYDPWMRANELVDAINHAIHVNVNLDASKEENLPLLDLQAFAAPSISPFQHRISFVVDFAADDDCDFLQSKKEYRAT